MDPFEWIDDIIAVDPVLTKENIKVGLRVQLHHHFYHESPYNPLGVSGSIYQDDGFINVQWDNGETNSYGMRELKIIGYDV